MPWTNSSSSQPAASQPQAISNSSSSPCLLPSVCDQRDTLAASSTAAVFIVRKPRTAYVCVSCSCRRLWPSSLLSFLPLASLPSTCESDGQTPALACSRSWHTTLSSAGVLRAGTAHSQHNCRWLPISMAQLAVVVPQLALCRRCVYNAGPADGMCVCVALCCAVLAPAVAGCG